MSSPSKSNLDRLLRPQSLAVIGASDDPARIGGRPLSYMKRSGFAGPLYPVNPKRDQVQGLPALASPDELPEGVDAAIVALPAPLVLPTVEGLIDRGVGGAVIFSSGFAEMGEEGASLQRRLADTAREAGLRILGPNCLGCYDSGLGYYATFTGTLEEGFPVPGSVGMASQSGAYASHLSVLAMRRGVNIRTWVTTGNECDLSMPEALAWLIEDPAIKVVMAYAEGITERDRLLAALEHARRLRKPVVFMKVGRSALGAVAAASHTASLAGSDQVYDAVLRQFGAYRAKDSEEFLDVAYAASRGIFPADNSLGVTTISGGVGVQMADAAEDFNLDMAAMPGRAAEEIRERVPFAAPNNPVDFTGQFYNDRELLKVCLEIMLREGGYDSIIAFLTSAAAAPGSLEPTLEAFKTMGEAFPDRLLINCMVGSAEIIRRYEETGCLVFEDPTRAVRAVAALCWFAKSFAMSDRAIAAKEGGAALPPGPYGEQQVKSLLSAAGLPMIPDRLAQDPEEAVAAAEAFGYPVVLKIASPDILHKTEIGGIALNLLDADAVCAAGQAILSRATEAMPAAQIEGLLVSPMAPKGVEVIMGVQNDPVFGPMVMLGLGGVWVEVLGDVAFRLAPFDESEAAGLIEELQGKALLSGARGQAPSDKAALCQALATLSQFAARHAGQFASLDINPVLVLPEGEGLVGLDAALVVRSSPQGHGAVGEDDEVAL